MLKKLLMVLSLAGSASAFNGTSTSIEDSTLQRNHLYIYASPLCAQCTLDLVWIKSFMQENQTKNYTIIAAEETATTQRYFASLGIPESQILYDKESKWIQKHKIISLPAYILTDPVLPTATIHMGSFNIAEIAEIALNISNGFQQKMDSKTGSRNRPAITNSNTD